MALKLFQGFCMALADSVPGVSGGTVAFILGFYEPFLNAIHSLFGKDPAARRAAFFYLLKLGIGWAMGLIGSISLLARLFGSNIYFLSSLFLGLTLASIPFIVKAERRQILGKPQNWPFALLGLSLVCGLTWFRAVSPSGGALDYTALEPLQYGYLFLSGALAHLRHGAARHLRIIPTADYGGVSAHGQCGAFPAPLESRRTAGAVRIGSWRAGGGGAVGSRPPRRPAETAQPDALADFGIDAGVPCLHCGGTRCFRPAMFSAGSGQFQFFRFPDGYCGSAGLGGPEETDTKA